jgi:NAD(P)H-flavin reductase
VDPAVIRRSLTGMTAGAQVCAGDFYGYLFTANGRLRDMFPPEMAAQNDRLFSALLRIVDLLDQPGQLVPYLSQLGADHRKYGVEPGHYAQVGTALLRALRRHCPAWSGEAEAAWASAYSLAADMMMSGAEACQGPATFQGRVVHHERRNADLAVLVVETDEPLPYQAGQYVTVQHARWPRVWRAFSVANAPAADGLLTLHVQAVPAGWVSSALVRDTWEGSKIVIGPAVGTMTSARLSDRDLVCVAGGTGLAPVGAIVEDVLAGDEAAVHGGQGTRRNITLFHGARQRLGLYDMPRLRELSDRFPWLEVVPVVSGDERFDGLKGDVAAAALAYADWRDREAVISGPSAMTCAALTGFRGAGVPGDQLHFDPTEQEGPASCSSGEAGQEGPRPPQST